MIGVFFWIICLAIGHITGYIISTDDQVAETVSSLSVLLAFSVLLNSVQSYSRHVLQLFDLVIDQINTLV